MKRIGFIILLGVVLCISLGAHQYTYKQIHGTAPISVAIDSADSTTQTGTAPLGDAFTEGFTSLLGKVYLSGPLTGHTDAGSDDSGWIWVYAKFANELHLLDSAVCGALPCSLRVNIPDAAGTDTLIKPQIQLDWKIYEEIHDTVVTFPYSINWNFYLQY
jgi:hypothetical protein